MPPPGYDVDPEKLDEGAKALDGLAANVGTARDTLVNDGELPTLDPLSKAMGAVYVTAVSLSPGLLPLVPLAKLAGEAAGKAISAEIDPYPPIRDAWLDALPRYQRLLSGDAATLRDTAEDYRRAELHNRQGFSQIHPR